MRKICTFKNLHKHEVKFEQKSTQHEYYTKFGTANFSKVCTCYIQSSRILSENFGYGFFHFIPSVVCRFSRGRLFGEFSRARKMRKSAPPIAVKLTAMIDLASTLTFRLANICMRPIQQINMLVCSLYFCEINNAWCWSRIGLIRFRFAVGALFNQTVS